MDASQGMIAFGGSNQKVKGLWIAESTVKLSYLFDIPQIGEEENKNAPVITDAFTSWQVNKS